MPNFVALGLMVSDKKTFQRFQKNLSFVAMATTVFKGIKCFQILSRNSEEDHGRNISVKFHQNPISSFREDV